MEDLDTYLEGIRAKLQSLPTLSSPRSAFTPVDVHWVEKEQGSTRRCLEMCAQGLARITKLSFRSLSNGKLAQGDTTALSTQDMPWADIMTLLALKDSSEILNDVPLRLRAHEGQVTRQVLAGAGRVVRTKAPVADGEFWKHTCIRSKHRRGVHVAERVKVEILVASRC
ncbi:hypothetical protein VDGL01_11129 [Verticillium dahliae]